MNKDKKPKQERVWRRRFEDHVMTSGEKSRIHNDKYASIDEQLDEAFQSVDKARKAKASKSLTAFIETYCVGLLLDDPPSELAKKAIAEMEHALKDCRPYQIELQRGSGKTSYVECAALYLLATGQRKFFVIISQNARSACSILKDIWRMIAEKDTAFAQDFPEVCKPFELCNGSFRRRQIYNDTQTELSYNASNIVFPRLKLDNGEWTATSGSVVTVRGITSGIRGLKVGKLRPDAVILDDLQDFSTAESPEQVQKLLDIIRKDVFNLAGKGKLAVLMTATPICPEDLAEHVEADTNWKTTKYQAIIKWPEDIEKNGDKGLWGKYFALFDKENVADVAHNASLDFYKQHRKEMDRGAQLFNPSRFKAEDGHISGLQALLEKRHIIGDAAFSAEMQMKPKRLSYSLDITPKVVVTKVNQFNELEVPEGFLYVAASTDLNTSYGLTTAIMAFKPDMTSVVLHHSIKRVKIDQKLNETEYNQQVYNALAELGRELKALPLKIDGWVVDCSGRQWDSATSFAKNSIRLTGLPCCAFSGRASTVFNPYIRTRLRDAIGRTVLCGNQAEHLRAGSGTKYVFWDADLYKEIAQKSFLSEVGAQGSCSLYKGDLDEHSDFAMQFCNEKLRYVRHGQDGKNHYTWQTSEPHDYLDCVAMCYACAASQGMSSSNIQTGLDRTSARRVPANVHRRIKVV